MIFAVMEKGKPMSKLKPCPLCGKPVTLNYSSFANAFEIRHANNKASWHCYIIEPFMLDAVSLADATEGWNRRFGDE